MNVWQYTLLGEHLNLTANAGRGQWHRGHDFMDESLLNSGFLEESTFSHENDAYPERRISRRDAHENTIKMGKPKARAAKR